ncbi:MAG: GGDEF domain-containing protein [Shewanella sp.]
MKKINVIGILLSFAVSIVTVHLFESINKDKLNSKFITNILFISDAIYRYNINSLNTELIVVASTNHDCCVMVHGAEERQVRDLSDSLDNLSNELQSNPIIADNLWTVASVYPEYIIPKPFRHEYVDLYERDSTAGDYLKHILTLENIQETLKNSALTIFETMSVFGPYVEEGTNEELFSIYYPLYLDREVFSVLVIDVKSDFIDDFVTKFNDEEMTWFELSSDRNDIIEIVESALALTKEGRNVSLPVKASLPYTGIAILLCTIILYSIFMFAEYLRAFYIESRIDKLSGFYRKDGFINNKLLVSSICLVDIDHFKKINDIYGHAVGDLVIAEVANRLKSSMRASDLAIRWGGEEFVIIFNGKLTFEQFNVKANQLLSVINGEKINHIAVTISIGALHSESQMPLQEAFHTADKALYQSKNSGRNQVTIYQR